VKSRDTPASLQEPDASTVVTVDDRPDQTVAALSSNLILLIALIT
jgi:hypothetical protein